MKSLIPFSEAMKRIHPLCKLESEAVPLLEAKGRILSESIYADRDFPPYNRVMMDGYAIQKEKTTNPSLKIYTVTEGQGVGTRPRSIESGQQAIPVSTGCVLPKDANAVVPVEWTKQEKGCLKIKSGYQVQTKQYIHHQASDYAKGDGLLTKGTFLHPSQLAIVASCGYTAIKVLKKLRIGLLVTGSELVPINVKPTPFQQRRSNETALSSIVAALTGDLPNVLFAGDKYQSVLQGITELKESCDLIVSTGGLALGAGDYTVEALEALGFHMQFHGVNQKPGKPIAYGVHPKTRQQVLALPGSPVSAIVTARLYLPKILSHPACQPIQAIVKDPPPLLPNTSSLIPGKIEHTGKIKPIYLQNSGDFATLKDSNGILYCPPASAKTVTDNVAFLFYPWL